MSIQPINAETFSQDQLTIGAPRNIMDNTWRMVNIGYKREETTDDKLVIMVDAIISSIYKGEKKNSILARITEEDHIELLKLIDEKASEFIFNNIKKVYTGISSRGVDAVDKINTLEKLLEYKKRDLIDYSEEYRSHSISVEDKVGNTIYYGLEDNAPLEKNMKVRFQLEISDITINMKNLQWNMKLRAQRIAVTGRHEKKTAERIPSYLSGTPITEDEIESSEFAYTVNTNKNNGKSLKIKNNNKTLVYKFENRDCYFCYVPEKDGRNESYSIAIPLEEDEANAFSSFDDKVHNYIFEEQKEIFNSKKKKWSSKSVFIDSVKPSITHNAEKDTYTLWAKIYKPAEGDLDLSEKVFQATDEDDEGNPIFEEMTTANAVARLFDAKETIKANISVFHRHIWLGQSISNSFMLSKVQVFIKNNVEYDMGIDTVPRDEEDEEEKDVEDETLVSSGEDDTSDEEED